MPRLRTRRLQCEALEIRRLLAGLPEFVASLPGGEPTVGPPELTVLGDTVYFHSFFATTGGELWKADGNSPLAELVKDVLPGVGSSFLNLVTPVNDKLLFQARSQQFFEGGNLNNRLWVSDGTEAGTHKLFDDSAPILPPSFEESISLGSRALFFANLSRDLWISDGTAAGTFKLHSEVVSWRGVAEANGDIYFVAHGQTAQDYSLWKSDGTVEGTVSLATFSELNAPMQLANVGGTLFFSAADSEHGRELWTSDGTPEGTLLFNDVVAGSVSSFPGNLTNANGRLAFSAVDSDHGRELWLSDGTAEGTTLIADIFPGSSDSAPESIVATDESVFWTANDGVHGEQIWRTNLQGTDTVRLTDFATAAPTNLIVAGSQLFFLDAEQHVWCSDGTTAGTHPIVDSSDQPLIADLTPLAARGDSVVVLSSPGVWLSDGTPAGTHLFAARPAYALSPKQLTPLGDDLYFAHGGGLWKSSGDPGDLEFVSDATYSIDFLTAFNGDLFYIRRDLASPPFQLVRYDVTDGTTTEVIRFPSSAGTPTQALAIDGTLYFGFQTSAGAYQLWASDGTTTGTALLKSFGTSATPSREFGDFTELNGKLYFTYQESSSATGLWTSDGSEAGTVQLASIPFTSVSMTSFQGLLYLGLIDFNTDARELWTSDGVSASLQAVSAWTSDGAISWNFASAGDMLFFSQAAADGPFSLWRTDGTAEGTVAIAPIVPSNLTGGFQDDPFLAGLGDLLYFSAWDSQHAEELWRSDGTPEGTFLVQDTAVPGGFFPANFTPFHDQLYFTGNDNEHGGGLWRIALSEDPELTVPPQGSFIEDSAPTLIAPNGVITDPDNASFAGGALTVAVAGSSADDRLSLRTSAELVQIGNQIYLSGQWIGTVAGGQGGDPLVIALQEGATISATQALLRSVQFSVASDRPDTTPRTISFQLRDGSGGWSSTVETILSVTARNDAPQLDASLNPRLTSTAEDAPTPSSTLVSFLLKNAVNDPDANALRGVAVFGTSNYHGTWQFSINGGTTWQAMGDVSESAARLLPGWARVRFVPKADFHGTVKLYYRAWDQTQGEVGGTFNLVGNTGGTKAFSTAYENASLTVTPVNDPPKLGLGGTLGYVHDSPAITLAAGALVSDVDSANFSGGRLRVWIIDGASTSNRLSIGAGFTVDANNNVLQGSTIIGKRVSSGWGTSELVITFNANVTPAVTQQLVRAITFKTVGGAAGKRTVLFTVSDGDGGVSAEAVKTVEVS